jgi:signal peptide peptidase SppA
MKEEKIWAGSETSLQVATEAMVKLDAMNREEEPCDDGPRLLSVSDGLATICIKGPLVNEDSPYLALFGVTGYPEIRDALLAAVNDPDVQQILLDIDSGGGQVSGCDDTGNLIRAVHKVKPVTTYSDTMASAAYWLGCSAGKVYSAKAALVGSIGVIATFVEYSKANEMEGKTVTIIRAGKHKALANRNEPLTEAAKAQIQAMADAAYGVFVEHVATMRGVDYATCDKKMADGQEFIGQAAVEVGLTDGIATYDAVVGGLKKKILASSSKAMDNSKSNRFKLSGSAAPTHSGESPVAKKALTEADIAALAAGATLLDDVPTKTEQEGSTNGLQTAQEDAPKAEVAVEAVKEPEKVATVDATVQLLNAQLKAKDEALLQAGIAMAKLQDFKDQYEAVLQPLKDIVARSANIMNISLGGHERAFAGMQPADLVAEHVRLSKDFSKFPIGGVAAVVTEEETPKAKADPLHLVRVNAARFQK